MITEIRPYNPDGLKGDFERGYAKGYERALEQLCELVGIHVGPMTYELVHEQADKLRKDVLNAS